MTADTDEALLQQYRSGNAAAFDRLYERYRIPVFNYIHRQIRQKSISEDIFQDVWMRVIRSIGQWKTGSAFSTWLYRIAHNRLIDYWRQQRPEQLESAMELIDGTATAEHLQFIDNCIERLKLLLNFLKPEQRDAFVLQQESGLTLEQIAAITGSGRETVKSRLRYALQKLKSGLEGCDE
jgi:RNA polymerase sigma-70 factor (ECF subfamily)